MLTIKVKLKDASSVRNYLRKNNLYNNDYLIKKTKTHIYFPIVKKDPKILKKFPDSKYINTSLMKAVKKQNYKAYLKKTIPKKLFNLLPTSYDVIGEIIIVDIPAKIIKNEKSIAQSLLKSHKNIKGVFRKAGIHKGEFRTQKLKHLIGKSSRETIYKENNIRLNLDVEKIYFSSRLSTERKRVSKQVKKSEKILVMFSGCGVYPLVISKNTKAKKIIGIEKNPIAHNYAFSNKTLNKVENVEFICGDVNYRIPELIGKFDRIIMPLPKDAGSFLDIALSKAKENTVIHFYDFAHIDNLSESADKIKKYCKKNNIKIRILRTVKCGQYSPCKFRVCVDFKLK